MLRFDMDLFVACRRQIMAGNEICGFYRLNGPTDFFNGRRLRFRRGCHNPVLHRPWPKPRE